MVGSDNSLANFNCQLNVHFKYHPESAQNELWPCISHECIKKLSTKAYSLIGLCGSFKVILENVLAMVNTENYGMPLSTTGWMTKPVLYLHTHEPTMR
jgi:hypothetical protein